jgi:3-dehydroquinate dehydratase I
VHSPSLFNLSAKSHVVGSFGNLRSLEASHLNEVAAACDVAEIRLDLLAAEGVDLSTRPWQHLSSLPLLFTARRADEGGAGAFPAAERARWLEQVADEACLIDIELRSANEMSETLDFLKKRQIPWVASWHDFDGKPESVHQLKDLAKKAADLGAGCFKAAIRLHQPSDLISLSSPLMQSSPLPLSLMGMGVLAPVSRLLCAQLGSVLNYGYLGDAPTAPGQWSAADLKAGIAKLERIA